jgi:hypothetical protein
MYIPPVAPQSEPLYGSTRYFPETLCGDDAGPCKSQVALRFNNCWSCSSAAWLTTT